MCKMFPNISWLENIAFVKGWYWDIAITIKATIFNLNWWLWSLIDHTNPMVNIWQISTEWRKIFNSLYHQKALQAHHKNLGQLLSKWLMNYQISVHESPMVCSFLLSVHMNFYCHNTYNKLKLRIWDYIFLDENLIHVTSENDKNTIGNDLFPVLTPVNFH